MIPSMRLSAKSVVRPPAKAPSLYVAYKADASPAGYCTWVHDVSIGAIFGTFTSDYQVQLQSQTSST